MCKTNFCVTINTEIGQCSTLMYQVPLSRNRYKIYLSKHPRLKYHKNNWSRILFTLVHVILSNTFCIIQMSSVYGFYGLDFDLYYLFSYFDRVSEKPVRIMVKTGAMINKVQIFDSNPMYSGTFIWCKCWFSTRILIILNLTLDSQVSGKVYDKNRVQLPVNVSSRSGNTKYFSI